MTQRFTLSYRIIVAIAVLAAFHAWLGCTEAQTSQISPPLPPGIKTVFLIPMENEDWSELIGNPSAPFINNTILPMTSHAEQYFNSPGIHPSLPNYLWLKSGTNFAILDDHHPYINHQGPTNPLVTLLRNAGVP